MADGDYVKPSRRCGGDARDRQAQAGAGAEGLLIRGMLSGAILGVATSLAFTGAVQTNVPLVGALIFPVGLIAIVLLGLELVTGSFAARSLPWLNGEAKFPPCSSTGAGSSWQPDRKTASPDGALIAIALDQFRLPRRRTGVAARIVAHRRSQRPSVAAIGTAA